MKDKEIKVNMICPKCNKSVIQYEDVIIHPFSDCDLSDGVEITIHDKKLQKDFKMMTKNRTIREVSSENMYTRVSKYLKRKLSK